MNKSSILSVSSRKKKEKELFVSMRQEEEEEDPEYIKVRNMKDAEYERIEKEKEEELKRLKILGEKREIFEGKYKEKEFTFDFEGDPFENGTLDEPLVYNSMKLRLTNVDKRVK